jgi:hypothetical protein
MFSISRATEIIYFGLAVLLAKDLWIVQLPLGSAVQPTVCDEELDLNMGLSSMYRTFYRSGSRMIVV